MPEIFMSYRRADAAATAGRLFDRLSEHFGPDQVFRDIDSLDAGDDFELTITNAIASATAVLVVIGQRWLDSRRADGLRRLDDPADYVRREIELALTSNALVIPVLVDDASIPGPGQLPESIRDLATRNAVELSHRRWQTDTDDLIRRLELRGIPPREPGAAQTGTSPVAMQQVLVTALVHFIPNLFALLRQPRTFLRRHARGRGADLTAAVIFFVLALGLALAVLLAEYTPTETVGGFCLAVMVMGSMATLMLSIPLWLGWRLVGVSRHYLKLLVVLLHQAAVVYLALFISMTIIIVAIDLASRNMFPEIIAELMKPGQSIRGGFEGMRGRFLLLAKGGELQVAALLAGIVSLAGAGWLVSSWGAYRDAFERSRLRSLAALFLASVVTAAGVALIRLMWWVATDHG